MIRAILTFTLGLLLGIFGASGYYYWHSSNCHTSFINQAREQVLQALAAYIHTHPDTTYQTTILKKLAAYAPWYETPKTRWKAREDVMHLPQAERTYIETIHEIARKNNIVTPSKKQGWPPILTPEAHAFFEETVHITHLFFTI